MNRLYAAIAILAIVLVTALVGVLRPNGRPPTVEAGQGFSDSDNNPPLRFAMTAAFVSEEGVGIYQELVDYVSKELGQPCQLVTGLSYRTVASMLSAGSVHVAFVCGLPYVELVDRPEPPVVLLAAPIMTAPQYKGVPKYYSYVITHQSKSYDNFLALRGCVYAYNDELSNSGYNMPRARLVELGQTGGFFGEMLRSGSHEESIRLVATGKADASSVDSLVLDFAKQQGDEYAMQVKVIETLGPAGIPPVVASAAVPPDLRDRIARIFCTVHKDEAGRAILDRALVDRFSVVEDDNYDDIRAMCETARAAGYNEIH